jgi:hypothetical protein
VADLKVYRDRLTAIDAGTATAADFENGAGTGSSTQAGGFSPQIVTTSSITLWTGGVVNYEFDPGQVSSGSLTPAMETQFNDAVAEWAAWANLRFVAYTSTQTLPANYIDVQVVSLSGEGGQSNVGMIGGEQMIQIAPNAWNRPTLCHEVGHALGLFHEQSRSDRDIYVTIDWSNIPGGTSNGNFVELPGSRNIGPYDFYSVMQYSQYADAVNASLPTITCNAGYTQYQTVIGENFDRTLSTLDRAGMAVLYGAPTTTPSAVVTNTNDSGPGSLRTALYFSVDQAAKTPPVATTITFNIPKTDPGYNATTGVFTIKPAYLLPSPGNGTTIDGTTESTFLGSNPNPSGGPPIVINGSVAAQYETIGAGFEPALILRTANCTVKGLVINGFDVPGLEIMSSPALGTVATGNVVSGCYIGTDATGTVAVPNGFYTNTSGDLGNSGLEIFSGAYNNTIGGTTAAARNIISGNTLQGIYMHDSGTTGNVIEGNYIGVNATGTVALPNGYAGIEIGTGGAQNNIVGGTTTGARNILSGNTLQGILIDGPGTTGNIVEGNYIGLNAGGTAAVANGSGNPSQHLFYSGVQLYNGAQNNIIGGTAAGAGNVISGNVGDGVAIDSSTYTASGNIVEGNTIGLNAAGTAAVANGTGQPSNNLYYSGVDLFGATVNNVIGGTAAGSGNVISGNMASGVNIAQAGTTGNLIEGNLIGTNLTGSAAIANGNASSPNYLFAGVTLSQGATSNIIGGTTSTARNIISGNAAQGVDFINYNTSSNVVEGNYIGTSSTGSASIANNQGVGLYFGASSNIIGGTTAGAGNVISGNAEDGITIAQADPDETATYTPTNNLVAGNLIGVNASGTVALPNGYSGVDIFSAAVTNTIGGTTAGSRNIIAGNTEYGVVISQPGTNGNIVQGNWIGVNAAAAAMSNGNSSNFDPGVAIFSEAQSNVVGGSTAGAGNLIADNTQGGVGLYNYDTPADTIKDTVSENSIFGNGSFGIYLYNNANENQVAPTLTSAIAGTSGNTAGTTISGTFVSAASTAYRVEFFASPSGGSQGQTFIGATSVTTNASGTGSFTTNLTGVGVPSGMVISATATDPNGNTSAFSSPLTVSAGTSGLRAQTITFPPIANQPFNAGTVTLNATSSSGLGVSYSVSTGSATVSSNTLTITGTGTITVQASQAGNGTYSAATPVTQTFAAGKGSQTITFPAIASTTYSSTQITLAATDSAGQTITYTVVSGPATISGNVLTLTGAGTVVVQAAQGGTTNYAAASPVSQSFVVRQNTQSITFPAIANQSAGANVTLTASATSGLPIVYSVISGPATVSSNTLTTTGTGTVTVQANQSGSANYFAANAVDQTFQVVTGSPAIATDTPTMPQWALIILGSLLAVTAAQKLAPRRS